MLVRKPDNSHPERLISGAIAHMRELGALYAALADDARNYAAEIKAR